MNNRNKKEWDEWYCVPCKKKFSGADRFFAHMTKAHAKPQGVEAPKEAKVLSCTHIDGDIWFSWRYCYEFTVGKEVVRVSRSSQYERDINDPMRYA